MLAIDESNIQPYITSQVQIDASVDVLIFMAKRCILYLPLSPSLREWNALVDDILLVLIPEYFKL